MDLVARMAAIIDSSPPSGAFTAVDYAKRYQLAGSTANEILKRMAREGKIQTAVFRAKDSRGHSARMHYYWLADAPDNPRKD